MDTRIIVILGYLSLYLSHIFISVNNVHIQESNLSLTIHKDLGTQQ